MPGCAPYDRQASLVIRAFLVAAVLLVPVVVQAGQSAVVARGEYVFRVSGCASCHTDSENNGGFLAGGRAFDTPFGTFYAPNITSHPEQGIGNWSERDFVGAMTRGKGPGGRHYFPVFPYTSYTRMTREDLWALYLYLATVPAIDRPSREHDLPWYLRTRWSAALWKLLFFDAGTFRPDPARSEAWNRGAYLSTAMAHCGECHTPRDRYGRVDPRRHFAGTLEGPEGGTVPNITPDRETGIGRWDQDEVVDYLRSGALPDGDFAGGLMAEVIDNGLQYLEDADAEAIATYVRSLPAVHHRVKVRRKASESDEFDY